jgi:hypothetical protein
VEVGAVKEVQVQVEEVKDKVEEIEGVEDKVEDKVVIPLESATYIFLDLPLCYHVIHRGSCEVETEIWKERKRKMLKTEMRRSDMISRKVRKQK